jgi:hypothetical protein
MIVWIMGASRLAGRHCQGRGLTLIMGSKILKFVFISATNGMQQHLHSSGPNLVNNLYLKSEDRLNTISNLSYDIAVVWHCIRRCRLDFETTVNSPLPIEEFINWLAMTWGIRVYVAPDGYNLSLKFDIIADDKYTMFILKYSK